MKFSYTVANPEGKNLTGVIEAPDEEHAKKELSGLGFSIISIREITEAPKPEEGLINFEFEATDKAGKNVVGTIVAENRYEAFKRLVTEYSFEVSTVVTADIPQTEKAKEKFEGVAIFKEKLDKEIAKEVSEKVESREVLMRKEREEYLSALIKRVLEKTKNFEENFGDKITAEDSKVIEETRDKLLRIKSSKNLEYIRSTAEDLLKLMQKQEIALYEKSKDEDKKHQVLQTKKLITDLHRQRETKSTAFTILERAKNAYGKSLEVEKPSIFTRIKTGFLAAVIRIFEGDKRLLKIKEEIRIVNSQILDYIKLYIKEKTPEYRDAARDSLDRLRERRKKLKKELREKKKSIRQESKEEREFSFFERVIQEFNSLTGWLLALYLIYYFAAIYLTTKNFGFEVPGFFYLYNTMLFGHVLAILLIIHALTSIKVTFFQKNALSNLIIFPLGFVFLIIVLFNL